MVEQPERVREVLGAAVHGLDGQGLVGEERPGQITMAEAVATMKALTNNNADQRTGIFLAFAIGYIVIVEVVALASYAVERKVRVAR